MKTIEPSSIEINISTLNYDELKVGMAFLYDNKVYIILRIESNKELTKVYAHTPYDSESEQLFINDKYAVISESLASKCVCEHIENIHIGDHILDIDGALLEISYNTDGIVIGTTKENKTRQLKHSMCCKIIENDIMTVVNKHNTIDESLYTYENSFSVKIGWVFINDNDDLHVVENKDIITGAVFARNVVNNESSWFMRVNYKILNLSTNFFCSIVPNKNILAGDTIIDYDCVLLKVSGRTPSKHHELICKASTSNKVRLVDQEYYIKADIRTENTSGGMMDNVVNILSAIKTDTATCTETVNTTQHSTYLGPLFEQLNLKNEYSKKIIAAYVMVAFKTNRCGVNSDNITQVKEKICADLCDMYELDTLCLAVTWQRDMLEIFFEHEPHLKTAPDFNNSLHSKYIWPFMRSRDVIPGVRMEGIRLHEND